MLQSQQRQLDDSVHGSLLLMRLGSAQGRADDLANAGESASPRAPRVVQLGRDNQELLAQGHEVHAALLAQIVLELDEPGVPLVLLGRVDDGEDVVERRVGLDGQDAFLIHFLGTHVGCR